jgi:hypothetical protein
MTEHKGYTHPEALVDADWVQAHLTHPRTLTEPGGQSLLVDEHPRAQRDDKGETR